MTLGKTRSFNVYLITKVFNDVIFLYSEIDALKHRRPIYVTETLNSSAIYPIVCLLLYTSQALAQWHCTNQRPEQTVSVTKLLYLSNSGLPHWSVVCVSWLDFNYITLTASSDAADAIKDAFGMRVNCLWMVTGLCLSHAVKPSYRG